MEIIAELERISQLTAKAAQELKGDIDHLSNSRAANERDRKDLDSRLSKLAADEADFAARAARQAEELASLNASKDAFAKEKVDYAALKREAEDAQRNARELQQLADQAKQLNDDTAAALKRQKAELDAKKDDQDKREREIIAGREEADKLMDQAKAAAAKAGIKL